MRILAATDGSRGGTAAVRFAARLAAGHDDGELIVLTVARPTPGAPEEPGALRGNAERILESAARRARRDKARAQYRLVATRPGTPIPETISREADRLKADLVVVGSEGRDTLNEWVLGGTALRLVYVSRRPVTVVRPPRRRKTA
ncbi:MAG TPA: universal stress protein [Thermoanaerobaculia bacterium]|jgi:nucleotide-binding universal stress UspA family protein